MRSLRFVCLWCCGDTRCDPGVGALHPSYVTQIAETIRLAEAEGNLQIESAAHGNRGWVLQQLGRKEEAEAEFSIAKEKKKTAQVKQEEEHRAYVNGEL